MNAAAIIAELKALPPEDFAEVSAFVLTIEREDPALQTALDRKRESKAGTTTSRPYEQSRETAIAALRTTK